ncbi:hypothetical protein Tco_0408441 [Tanacetum coccineum]
MFVDIEFLPPKPPVSDDIDRTDVIFAFTLNPQRWTLIFLQRQSLGLSSFMYVCRTNLYERPDIHSSSFESLFSSDLLTLWRDGICPVLFGSRNIWGNGPFWFRLLAGSRFLDRLKPRKVVDTIGEEYMGIESLHQISLVLGSAIPVEGRSGLLFGLKQRCSLDSLGFMNLSSAFGGV